ncbi:response regulator [Natrialbaceae archaeon GCM10025810]|uniref:response regulator n=1 Tax=Halovalidus salilacus TaxID=3075124 RepID=UPI003615068C
MNADDVETTPIDILLVEPSPGDTRLFTEGLKEGKLLNSVRAVADAQTALDVLHRRGEYEDASRPDLILLEPKLPGSSGMDLLEDLEDEPALREIPVVVLTSSDVGEEIVKSRGPEADCYIRKPVDVDQFVSFVQSLEEFWVTIVRETPAE